MSFSPWKLLKQFTAGTLVRAAAHNENLQGIENSFAQLDAIYKNEMLRLPDGYAASNKIPNKTLNNALLFFDADANLDVYHLATFEDKISQASTSAANASASASAANTSAANASASASAANTSASLAYEFANNPVDQAVAGGGFSALHYATKAQQAANEAASYVGGTADNSAKLGNQLPSYYAKAQDLLTPVPINAKFTDTITQVLNSYTSDSTTAAGSANMIKYLKERIDQVIAGGLRFNFININDRHYITENDGIGQFNIRVGHKSVNVEGIYKNVVTEAGTQFHIRFDNVAVGGGMVVLVASSYGNDGDVGDFITGWQEVGFFSASEFKAFGDLFRVEKNGAITTNALPVQSKRTQFNPPQGTIVRKTPVEKLVFGTWGSEWRTLTLDDNTFQVNDEVVIDWINDTASRAIIKSSTAVIYYNGVAQANGINIFGKPKQVLLTKISTNSWVVTGLYLDRVAYQHYPTLSVLVKEATHAKYMNWNGTSHSYTIDSDSFDSGDTLEFIRSYSVTGTIIVTLNAGSIFFNNTALGAQVRNAGRPHKLVLEKATNNNWIMRVEKLGVAQ